MTASVLAGLVEATVVTAAVVDDVLASSSQAASVTRDNTSAGMHHRAEGVLMSRQSTDAPDTIERASESSQLGPPTSKATMLQQVEETIEAIRPALQADGGDIVLRGVDETTGIVTVTLVGACGTCPASSQTLKAGIERIMRDRVDGVTEVVAV